jgi:hypothetical protein
MYLSPQYGTCTLSAWCPACLGGYCNFGKFWGRSGFRPEVMICPNTERITSTPSLFGAASVFCLLAGLEVQKLLSKVEFSQNTTRGCI